MRAEDYNNLGINLKQQGKFIDSVKAFKNAIKLNPNSALIHYNLGNAYQVQNKLNEAKSAYLHAISLDPSHSEIHNNLGVVYTKLGPLKDALKHFRLAIKLNPNSISAYTNLGDAYLRKGDINQSRNYYQQVLGLDPQNPKAHHGLAYLHYLAGEIDPALKNLETAINLDPDSTNTYSDLLLLLMKTCNWPKVQELKSLIISRRIFISPFVNIAVWDNEKKNLMAAKKESQNLEKQVSSILPHYSFVKHRRPNSKIRLGYLSSDFHDHATAHLISGLFKLHDRKRFEVFAYSYGPNNKSCYRTQISHDCDKFIDLENVSHLRAAKQIFKDQIDILIDLKGHTLNSRLEICAPRPAPIQVTYLGFPGTSGAKFFDYAIVDKIVVPPSHSKYYTEKLVYLPNSYQVNSPIKLPKTKLKRKDFNLPENAFVFVSFNATFKIEPVMFNIWMKILKAVPTSVLWLMNKNPQATQNLKNEAKKRGVNPKRLVFAKRLLRTEHLLRHRLADLGLDTRIYNGHTTTSDALFAGLPVITLQGKHFASRVASSLLTAVGLPELITYSLKKRV